MSPSATHDLIEPVFEDVQAASERVADVVRRTPVLTSRSVSDLTGGQVVLKAENLQRTGSFKLRGALNKLRAMPTGHAAGVVAGSAGNHAQSLAYAARRQGTPCRVYMPATAAVSKVAAAQAQHAEVIVGGASVDECVAAARAAADREALTFVHPFDDPLIVAGQGTLGLELLDDVPRLAQVVVPVGGGGLAAGIAIAVKHQRPDVRVIGVQVAACAPFAAAFTGRPTGGSPMGPTIADGIAIKRPGALTLSLLQRRLDEMVVVDDDAVADAMVFLLERAKLVVEGAGAAGLAALMDGRVAAAQHGTTAVVLSGGNVDAGLLAAIARRGETAAGRRLRLFARVPDQPGGLAALLSEVADSGANIVSVEHVRDAVELHVRETGVDVVLETRGREHAQRLLASLAEHGFLIEATR